LTDKAGKLQETSYFRDENRWKFLYAVLSIMYVLIWK